MLNSEGQGKMDEQIFVQFANIFYQLGIGENQGTVIGKFLEALELILFKGYGHFKRGQGISIIPWKRFGKSGKDIYELFNNLFTINKG